MSSRGLNFFPFALWLCGFFPVDDPRNAGYTRDIPQKGYRNRIRRLLIFLWSLILAVYPPLFHLEFIYNTGAGLLETENQRLSVVMPWLICEASQFVVSAIARLLAMANSGKFANLMQKMRSLKLNAIEEARTATQNGVKWRLRNLVLLVYVGHNVGEGFSVVRDLVTNENQVKGLNLYLLPNVSDRVRILMYHFIMTTLNLTPIVILHFIFKFGSDLIQVHVSVCAELRDLLAGGRVAITEKVRNMESYFEVHSRASRLHERFCSLKECFKIYEQLSGAYAFCIVWWVFVVIVTVFSSVTAGGMPKAHVINYGIWQVAMIYMLASFGEHMTNSIDQGRETISNTFSAIGVPKYVQDETEAIMVINFHQIEPNETNIRAYKREPNIICRNGLSIGYCNGNGR